MKVKASPPKFSIQTRAGKKVIEESLESFVEEPCNTQNQRGRPEKTSACSEPLLDDYPKPNHGTKMSTRKNSKRGNSQPLIGVVHSGRKRKATTPSTAGRMTAKKPTAAQVNKVGSYLRSVRLKLLNEDARVPKDECEKIQRQIKQKAILLLQWSQSCPQNMTIHYQVKDLIVVCGSLHRELESRIDDSSSAPPTPEPDYFRDNPGTSSSQPHQRTPEENTRTVYNRAVSNNKKMDVRGTDGLGQGRNQEAQISTNKTPESRPSPAVSRRAVKSGFLAPPVVFDSNLVGVDTLSVQNIGSPVVEELTISLSCAHECGCAPQSSKVPVPVLTDQGTNTNFAETAERADVTTQTNVTEFKKSNVLVDSGTNTELYYSIDWNESSEDDKEVPDFDGIENVDPASELIRGITGILLPRECDYASRPYDNQLREILSNPDAVLPQEYLDDMTWDSD